MISCVSNYYYFYSYFYKNYVIRCWFHDQVMRLVDSESKSQQTVLLPNNHLERQTMASSKKLMIYAVGIFVCYFYFGILQEKM